MRALGDRAIAIRGNGERELVEARLRLDAGTARIDPGDIWSSRTHWAAGVLDQERLDWMGALPPLASVEIDGLGDVLFCHASPRSDEEIVTPLSRPSAHRADARRRGAAHRRARPHARAVRPAGRRDAGSSTPAASACPTRARAAAFWALLGPGVELRRTRYDVDGDLRPRARDRHSGRRGIRRGARTSAARRRGERVLRAHGDEPLSSPARPTSAQPRPDVCRRQTPYSAASQVSRWRLTSARNCAA